MLVITAQGQGLYYDGSQFRMQSMSSVDGLRMPKSSNDGP